MATTSTFIEPAQSSTAVPARYIAAAVAGNALEVFDFTTYSYFALQIGRAFFPSHDPLLSELQSLATFFIGFIGRPLGAYVFGAYADARGRRPALMLSLLLMGIGVLAIALAPPYAAIGAAAPVLVIAARLIQGFAMGGELGTATAFLVEIAPQGRRGLYGSWQSASQGLASATSGVIGVAVSALVSAQAMDVWGWRVPFLVGAAALPVALVMRRNFPETHKPDARPDVQETRALLTQYRRNIAIGFFMIAGTTIPFYALSYMTTFAQSSLHMGTTIALAATVVFGLSNFGASLVGGYLSDRVGRKPILIWPRVALILSVYPAYLAVVHLPSAPMLLGVTALLAVLNFLSGSVTITVLAESVPKPIRGLASGGAYATAVAIFGGSTQFVIAWLIDTTGNKLAPALYLAAASVVAVIAYVLVPETSERFGATRQ
jgi:MFS family permease